MKHSAVQDKLGLDAYMKKGYIPADHEHESVSKTLEYAYDDWSIATMAKELGKEEDAETFMKRGQYYKNIFDPGTGFMRARMNGSWFKPFDPAEVNFNYTEANSWQYSFFVPQDVQDLVYDVLRHRILLTYEAEAEEVTTQDSIGKIVERVPVP